MHSAPHDTFHSSVPFLIIVAVLAVSAGVGTYKMISRLHDLDTNFNSISTLDRQLTLYSEQAFYTSFYWDIATSNASISEGITNLLYDSRSEYPGVINAIERFNVYPEVVAALIYRTFKSVMPDDPLLFMAQYLYVLSGIEGAAIVFFAAFLGRSVIAPVVALVFCFAYQPYATRINTQLTLRENYAVPFLWLQIAILTFILQRALDATQRQPLSKGLLAALVVVTLSFMLSWQFAQFVLLLQSSALFATYILGYIDSSTLLTVTRCHAISLILNIGLSLGNAMLATGLLVLFLFSIEIAFMFKVSEASLLSRIFRGLIAVVAMGVLKYGCGFLVEDDGHIFRILLAKLFGFEDFMTWLYLCGPTYRAMNWDSLVDLSTEYLFPITLFYLAIVV